jgi:hypothetical protein
VSSPLESALRDAMDHRLWSMVYAALNWVLESTNDPEEQIKEWRELGAWPLTEILVASPCGNESPYGLTYWINPWIAQHLHQYDAHALIGIVEEWLERHPLPPNISDDLGEEDPSSTGLSRKRNTKRRKQRQKW